jgi:hypothetical protein
MCIVREGSNFSNSIGIDFLLTNVIRNMLTSVCPSVPN